jgi:hypothetical protein
VAESSGDIIGNGDAPYVNSLADACLKATYSHGHTHDSLPNYLEMVSVTC